MTRTWLITGTSRGFGLELAKVVLDKGHSLVATARRPEQLAALVDTYGDRVRPFALDVTDAQAARDAVAFAVAEFGSLDFVVNNAGYADSVPIEEMTDTDFRNQVEANLFGTVNVSKAALPVMRAQRSGTIVQFSSVGGRVGGTPGMGAYQTAKFAVEGFSEVLANEVRPLGIRVMIVEPGAFRTDWQGASMKLHDVGPDYADTVGALNTYRAANASNQPGDPARAAKIIVDTVNGDDLPMRLVLGSGAVDMIRSAAVTRAAETEKWASVSATADFPAGE
jgi:NAD(P)-dependent dehydrogenase (short-subunit alcohol dehydrogenase family)